MGPTIIPLKPDSLYLIPGKEHIVTQGKEISEIISEHHLHWAIALGAVLIGAVIGWNLYFINRYRNREGIGLPDLTTLVGTLLGGGVLAFFGNSIKILGYYGIGVFLGFFGYFIFLIILTKSTSDPNGKWPDFFLKLQIGQTPAISNKDS